MCGAVTDCNQQQKTLKIVAESLTNSSKKPETPHKLTAGCYSEYSTFYSAQISQDKQYVVKLEVRSIVQNEWRIQYTMTSQNKYYYISAMTIQLH